MTAIFGLDSQSLNRRPESLAERDLRPHQKVPRRLDASLSRAVAAQLSLAPQLVGTGTTTERSELGVI
jgi:hypothetical protein